MVDEEEEQGSFLKNAEVYNLLAEYKTYEIVSMGKKAVPALVSILKNGDCWKKAIAIDILANIDGPSSIRALKLAAQDPESGIRGLAAVALLEKEGKTADKAVQKMRDDPSGQIARKVEVLLLRRKRSEPPQPNGKKVKNGNKLAL